MRFVANIAGAACFALVGTNLASMALAARRSLFANLTARQGPIDLSLEADKQSWRAAASDVRLDLPH